MRQVCHKQMIHEAFNIMLHMYLHTHTVMFSVVKLQFHMKNCKTFFLILLKRYTVGTHKNLDSSNKCPLKMFKS